MKTVQQTYQKEHKVSRKRGNEGFDAWVTEKQHSQTCSHEELAVDLMKKKKKKTLRKT